MSRPSSCVVRASAWRACSSKGASLGAETANSRRRRAAWRSASRSARRTWVTSQPATRAPPVRAASGWTVTLSQRRPCGVRSSMSSGPAVHPVSPTRARASRNEGSEPGASRSRRSAPVASPRRSRAVRLSAVIWHAASSEITQSVARRTRVVGIGKGEVGPRACTRRTVPGPPPAARQRAPPAALRSYSAGAVSGLPPRRERSQSAPSAARRRRGPRGGRPAARRRRTRRRPASRAGGAARARRSRRSCRSRSRAGSPARARRSPGRSR